MVGTMVNGWYNGWYNGWSQGEGLGQEQTGEFWLIFGTVKYVKNKKDLTFYYFYNN